MKISKKFLHALIILTMMSFFMFGCGKTEVATDTTEKEDVVVEVPETTTEVEEPQKEEVEESEVVPEEEITDEPIATDEPVEVISIKEYADLTNYITTLDPDQPEIIIFNGVELYMIHMKEGQHYQLKTDDEIIFSYEGSGIGYGWKIELGNSTISIDNHNIFEADYSKFEQEQEFYLKKKLDNGEIVQRTCYLTPPTE